MGVHAISIGTPGVLLEPSGLSGMPARTEVAVAR
jgi:hypothetical protein